MRGAIKAAVGDGLLTFMWIFCASSLGVLTLLVSSALGVAQGLPTLAITTFLVFILLFIFGFIGDLLGGATFNPTATAAFYAAGLGGPDSLISAAIRFPAQAAGAVGGALAILEAMPIQYKHMLQGPSLKVDLHTGAIAEGVLTFVITLSVLIIVIRGPRSLIIKNLLLAMSTVTLVVAGSGYTGPSMNPANESTLSWQTLIDVFCVFDTILKKDVLIWNSMVGGLVDAFGWAYVNNKHNTWEQFYVYWICPFVGAILAAWVFRFLFPPPTTNQKKAKKA
ncbi:aquaporin sip1-1 [Phtheirospermum japonicum]|uniref:Aquaporin sip1-1 n=1 Tax=Phtheirospermum japonicum TaxID=374723 RepID=A0A830CSA7_9LAMI|nr:aquaporin sip1-1 [Phtheirospermum japonicum]